MALPIAGRGWREHDPAPVSFKAPSLRRLADRLSETRLLLGRWLFAWHEPDCTLADPLTDAARVRPKN